MIRKLFKWIFKSELQELNNQIKNIEELTVNYSYYEKSLENILANIDISIDVHQYHSHSHSWAVISLQGVKSDYLKFVELGDKDIREIQLFLRKFDREYRTKIDATPTASKFLKNRYFN